MRITKKVNYFSTFYLSVRYDKYICKISWSCNYCLILWLSPAIATKHLYLRDVVSVVKTITIANFSWMVGRVIIFFTRLPPDKITLKQFLQSWRHLIITPPCVSPAHLHAPRPTLLRPGLLRAGRRSRDATDRSLPRHRRRQRPGRVELINIVIV